MVHSHHLAHVDDVAAVEDVAEDQRRAAAAEGGGHGEHLVSSS